MKTKSLSAKQALACEHATESRCRCRCDGQYHGRGLATVQTEDDLSKLRPDDPHYIAPPADKFLRAVVSIEDYSRRRNRITLACGHQMHPRRSRKIPKRAHCDVCAAAARSGSFALRAPKSAEPREPPHK